MIAFDYKNKGGATDITNANPLTIAHTCTGSDLLLLVGGEIKNISAAGMSATYNSVAMNLIYEDNGNGNVSAFLFWLIAPATGTHNVVITPGNVNSTEVYAGTVSYTGVLQTGFPDSQNVKQGSYGNPDGTFSIATTVVASNCWISGVAASHYGYSMTCGSNLLETASSTNGYGTGDSNGTVGTGSQSIAFNNGFGGNKDWAGVLVSFAPAIEPSVSPSLSPSISPSKSPSISPSVSPSASISPSASKSPSISPSVSPSVSISPSKSPSKSPSLSPSVSPSLSPSASKSPSLSPSLSPSISPSVSPSIAIEEEDLPATLSVSGYKWLTQTLETAQQQYTVRPYFTTQIIDDTIKPTANIFTNTPPYSFGSAAPTPDGNIVAAGFDASNHIHFYKGRNLGSGSWDSDTVLDTNSGVVSAYAVNQVAIAVSEMHNSYYHIDVAYFTNFDGSLGYYFGNYLGLCIWSSDDSGQTWTLQNSAYAGYKMSDLPIASYNSAATLNLYLALMKPRLVSGTMTSGILYLCPNSSAMSSGYTSYDLKYSVSPFPYTSYNILAPYTWGGNVNSQDWTIHSFDSYYINGIDYMVFCGFRSIIDTPNNKASTQNPNYALWLTGLSRRSSGTGGSLTPDLWLPPTAIIAADSANYANQNQYLFPRAVLQNDYIDILLKAVTVDSISPSAQGATSVTITTHENYQLIHSVDGQNFSYPEIMVNASGTEIVEPSASNQLQSFVAQDNYYYICGGNQIYQFVHNNIVADISTDVIGYTIQETAGQPSSINLQVANQNNQWVGASPTKPGAAAIASNSKIALWQGYYNASGVQELVPRNVYYIDDVTQQISGNQNDLAIAGRDWFKKLKLLITRFALQWLGPFFYADVFDGTTLSNWNQINGTWVESGNAVETTSVIAGDMVVTLAMPFQMTESSLLVVNAGTPGNNLQISPPNYSYIYAFYIDSNNWLRLSVNSAHGWSIDKCINGAITSGIDGGTKDWGAITRPSAGDSRAFFVRQYDYYKWNFMYSDAALFSGNPLDVWNDATLLKSYTSGEIDLTSDFAATASLQKSWTVALGCKRVSVPFSYFRYTQFGPISNIFTLTKSLAARAGITDIIAQNQFTDLLTLPSYYGTFTVQNRKLVIPPSSYAMNNESAKQISNGEVLFTAKVTPILTGADKVFGLCFYFRNTPTGGGYAPWKSYVFRIWQYVDSNGLTACRFERFDVGANTYIFPNSAADDYLAASPPAFGSLNIDLTQYHKYQITMIDGWMYAFIDGVMVASWNDNNSQLANLTTGYWGFAASDSNSTVTVKDISSPYFWKPVQSFSFNPGDDAENSLFTLIQSIYGWFFSDLLGRMKMILLSSADVSGYLYSGQIWNQQVDNSDKEYVTQVTVYGTGVQATARNTTLMAGQPTREAIVVDYNITTVGDAQTRANKELIDYSQYVNQYTPTQVMNVGSELFDAITVTNTGNNTSGVDASTRVYGQTLNEGGGSHNTDYSISIQSGNL